MNIEHKGLMMMMMNSKENEKKKTETKDRNSTEKMSKLNVRQARKKKITNHKNTYF